MDAALTGTYASILNEIRMRREASAPVLKEVHYYSLNTANDGALGGVECPVCNNTGMVITKDGFVLHTRECDCMNLRRNKKRIRESGLSELMENYTMSNYKVVDPWTKFAKQRAVDYINSKSGWFYIYGITGSGKTHICTAICSELMNKGKIVKYVIWSDLVQELRTVINDIGYDKIMRSLKEADVLYIDDFLKNNATEADAKRAIEIINARYNIPSKKTIISSERPLEYVANIDPAVMGRINERSRGFVLKTPNKNWRV